ncbi:phage baseplate plug family protein [Rhizobium rosettiformans]|uniref:phage baseplate plug family protein n=1 Tax=Rhizobium rosettiformans TaxID=1368430 RepID=UPI002860A17A|nr:hypothetical protein [Rhizobium rosettiformans]MDR7027256.1 hypothetical protein [Rhizobium rosettiformans]MDR7065377.1 hypothetical protein [Rhizobium rosettiformans]
MNRILVRDFPDQQFGTIINGRRVTFRFRYNVSTDRWTFDLSVDDLPILHGRKIVGGTDLMAPFRRNLRHQFRFEIGYLVAVPITKGAVPDRQSLPNGEYRIYHLSNEEADSFNLVSFLFR